MSITPYFIMHIVLWWKRQWRKQHTIFLKMLCFRFLGGYRNLSSFQTIIIIGLSIPCESKYIAAIFVEYCRGSWKRNSASGFMSMTTKLQKLGLTQNENILQVNEYIDLKSSLNSDHCFKRRTNTQLSKKFHLWVRLLMVIVKCRR